MCMFDFVFWKFSCLSLKLYFAFVWGILVDTKSCQWIKIFIFSYLWHVVLSKFTDEFSDLSTKTSVLFNNLSNRPPYILWHTSKPNFWKSSVAEEVWVRVRIYSQSGVLSSNFGDCSPFWKGEINNCQCQLTTEW